MDKFEYKNEKDCESGKASFKGKGGTRNGKKRYKGNHRTGKSSKSAEKRFEKGGAPGSDDGSNDFSWYNKYPDLINAAANITWGEANGFPIQLDTSNSTKYTQPGIMALRCMPAYGMSKDEQSPLNTTSLSVFEVLTRLRSAQKGYDAADVTMYLIAVCQVYSCINWLTRIYAEARAISMNNAYLPRGLFEAEAVDMEDLVMHLEDYRGGLNYRIAQAAAFVVPNTMPIFQRQAFMYQNIYSEGTSIKDQLYMFVPESFLRLNEVTDSGMELNTLFVWRPEIKYLKYQDLLGILDKMIAPILNSTAIKFIATDILHAYDGKILSLGYVPENLDIAPMFNVEVLEQIHNATINPFINYELKQKFNSNNVAFQVVDTVPTTITVNETAEPMTLRSLLAMRFNKLITTTTAQPSIPITVENTRLMSWCNVAINTTSGTGTLSDFVVGSEIVSAVEIVYMGENNTLKVKRIAAPSLNVMILNPDHMNLGLQSAFGYITPQELAQWSQFKFAPLVALYATSAQASDVSPAAVATTFQGMYGDIDNYAIMHPDTLETLNRHVMFSLFDAVPFAVK
nr:capsid protein [Rat picobirnavirus]